MRVYPKPLEIGDEEGFTPEKDLFRRSELAKGMSHLVATVEDPLVIAFDGPWGSGKTTFLKMWAGELRKSGHPVIFFDAFENDYVEDAFAVLVREIVELAESKKPTGDKVARDFREKAVGLGTMLLKGSAKIGMKVAIRAATAGLTDAADLGDFTKDAEKEAEDAAAAYMDQLLDQPRRQKEIADQFRQALGQLPALLCPPVGGEPQKPLIFIIDELDRCKPHFALALLERIKHFMTVPNVHFVLGVHLRQLQNSVTFAYGTDVDAVAYLQKFINLTIMNIVINDDERRTDLHVYAQHLAKSLAVPETRDSPLRLSVESIIRIAKYEQITYRTLERAFTVLALAIGLTPQNLLQLGPIMGGLVMMKLLNADLFSKAKKGTLSYTEAMNFLHLPLEYNEDSRSSEERWWTYLLAPNLIPETDNSFQYISFNYNIGSGKDTIIHMANKVIDRLSSN